MTGTLCDLAASLPLMAGALLDREARLKRGRFREETLTDVFVASLAAFAGPELVIEYPHEATTGGDIDLEFWHVESGRRLLLRLQAKRLSATTKGGKLVPIEYRSYHELLHKVTKTAEYQFQTLMDKSGDHLPLYIFYNHASVSADPFFATKSPQVTGINLAFAFDIHRELQAKLDAQPKVLHHKRLSHLQPHLFGLDAILCPGGKRSGLVPTPDAVSEALRTQWREHSRDGEVDEDSARVLRYFLEPPSIVTGRDLGRRLADGPAIRPGSDVRRATVTFISGRTKDERTPTITSDASR